MLLVTPDRIEFEYALRFKFPASSNEANYEAFLPGVHLALELEAKHIKDYSNSQLVMNQINEELQSQDKNMATYMEAVKVLVK